MMRDRTIVAKATVGSVSTKVSWNTRTKGIGLERTLNDRSLSVEIVVILRIAVISYLSTDVMLKQYTTAISRVSGALT